MSFRPLSLVALALVALLPALAHAVPLGPAFTYQGELRQSGVPVDGTVSLRFSLWAPPREPPPRIAHAGP